MGTYNPGVIITLIATGVINSKRFVTAAGAQAGAGAFAIGVADDSAASGEEFPVVVTGVAEVEAGGSISKGDFVTPDADGKATTAVAASGNYIVGVALDDAASGEVLRVLLVSAGAKA